MNLSNLNPPHSNIRIRKSSLYHSLIFLLFIILCSGAYLLTCRYISSNLMIKVSSKENVCQDYATLNFTKEQIPPTSHCGMSIYSGGRLGNFMGQYATLYALSRLNNQTAYIIPSMADLLHLYFKISTPTLEEDVLKFWEKKWKYVRLTDWMQPGYLKLQAPFVYLIGYPNSWTFYHHLQEEIRREFQFHDVIMERTRKKLHFYGKHRTSTTFVGIHVRRRDYVTLMEGSYRGVVAHRGFFDQAMDYFNSKYSDAIFLVISDDLEWCRKNINNSRNNVFFVGNGNLNLPIYDLALMAHCNHSIITIGTFGYWGAYLAGGETVYLYNYTLPDSPFLEILRYNAFYLPQWLPIQADLTQFKKTLTQSSD